MSRMFAGISLSVWFGMNLGLCLPCAATPEELESGWIDKWEVSGPYISEYQDRKTKKTKRRDARQLFGTGFPPQNPGDRSATWKPIQADAGHAVDLGAAMPDSESACAYLRTCVVSPKAQTAQLEVGSDDGVIVWWNGRAIVENNALRTFTAGQDERRIQLRKGCNALLVKVTQDKADWKAAVRILGENGNALAGVQSDAGCAAESKMVLPPLDATPQSFSGVFEGTLTAGGEAKKIAAHVLGRPHGNYQINLLPARDERVEPIASLMGRIADGDKLDDHVAAANGQVEATISGGILKGSLKGDKTGSFELRQIERASPTLGAKPPAGAVVLLGPNMKDLEAFGHGREAATPCKWKLLPGGVMQVTRSGSVVSKSRFKGHRLHVEFRSPYEPHHLGQARGNSGVYVQGRYEVQVLDSFGLEGKDNECGGIYKTGRPIVNMCYPPGMWQTYDIDFTATRFEGAQKTAEARITVRHNGVVIHDDLKIPKPTGGSLDRNEDQPGPLMLQDHGNPVEFRNIWVVEK